MFGHDHNNQNNNDQKTEEVVQPTSPQPINDALLGLSNKQATTGPTSPTQHKTPTPLGPVPAPNPAANSSASNTTTAKSPSPQTNSTPQTSTETPSPSPSTSTSSQQPDPKPNQDDTSSLLKIKKEALDELSPLISHLDQSPEEKFRTTMMMIQASDNKDLVPDAFKAAREIKNDQSRAQALLDIVNEINYFTQPQNDNES